MRYKIELIRITKNWERITYDKEVFDHKTELLEYIDRILNEDTESTLLIFYKKVGDDERG